MIEQDTTNVLLPRWIWEQKDRITEKELRYLVYKYLVRYKDYELIEVQGDFAICRRKERSDAGDNKKGKKGSYQGRTRRTNW